MNNILEKTFREFSLARYYVLFSGGKDSLVALHLSNRIARDLNIDYLSALHIDTTIAWPENLEYVRRTCEKLKVPLFIIRPRVDFFERVKKLGFPSVTRRWCTKYLKFFPTKRFLKRHHFVILIDGIRSSESSARARRYKEEFSRYWNLKNRYVVHPILRWTEREVSNYIRSEGLEVNPLYETYGSSGCYFCPFITNQRHYLRLRLNHPELFRKILEAEEGMKGSSAFLCHHGKKIYAKDLKDQKLLEGFR